MEAGRHKGVAAAAQLLSGRGQLPPPPAASTALPAELLRAVEREFARRHGTRPPSTADSIAFLAEMLETRYSMAPRTRRPPPSAST